MMRLIAVAILVLGVGTVCIFGQCAITDCGKTVGLLLREGMEAASSGDTETARQKALEAEKTYMHAEQRLSLFIHHDLVEDLGIQIARLSYLAETETLAEYRSEVSGALVMLTHVVNDERPRLSNIF